MVESCGFEGVLEGERTVGGKTGRREVQDDELKSWLRWLGDGATEMCLEVFRQLEAKRVCRENGTHTTWASCEGEENGTQTETCEARNRWEGARRIRQRLCEKCNGVRGGRMKKSE